MLVDVFVAVLVFNGVRWNGHYEAAVLNAFEANEPIGELFNLGRLSVDDEHLKAGVVIETSVNPAIFTRCSKSVSSPNAK